MKNHYVPSSFTEGYTYNERTDRFVGVDLTDPQMTVALKRGVYSKDYLRKPSGRVETRYGYLKVYDDASHVIRGIWQGKFNGQDKIVALVFEEVTLTGSGISFTYDALRFYECSVNSDKQLVLGNNVVGWLSGEVSDADSVNPQGIFADDKLWVLTGHGYVVVYWDSTNSVMKASAVSAWNGCHVPTVTYMGIASNVDSSNIPSVTNVTLEYPSLLSKYRKDLFLAGLPLDAENEDEPFFPHFHLQDCKNVHKLSIETHYSPDEWVGAKNKGPTFTLVSASSDVSNKVVSLLTGCKEILVSSYNKTAVELWSNATGVSVDIGEALYDDSGSISVLLRVGDLAVTANGVLSDSGAVVLFENPKPIIPGKPNVTIEYQYVSDSDFATQKEMIETGHFGCRFGANNALNRLWVYKDNMAISCAEPYKGLNGGEIVASKTDFSYFPDSNLIKFGSEIAPIVAMQVVSTGKMMVLKKKNPANEPTMFFVTPTSVERPVTSSDSIIEELYSTVVSNTSTAGYCMDADINLNGDALFFSSDKQVVGLDIEGITGDSQRVANSRSHFIDKELSESVGDEGVRMAQHKNYALLFTKEKAYAAYRDSYDGETGQYDWWPLSLPFGEKVDGSFEVGESVYFVSGGTVVGLVEDRQDNMAYDEDRYYIDGGEIGDVGVSSDGYLTVSQAICSKIPNQYAAKEENLSKLNAIVSSYYDEDNNQWIFKTGSKAVAEILSSRIAAFTNQQYPYYVELEFVSNKISDGFYLKFMGSRIGNGWRPEIFIDRNEDEYTFECRSNNLSFRIGNIRINGDYYSNEGIVRVGVNQFGTRDPFCLQFIKNGRQVFLDKASDHENDEVGSGDEARFSSSLTIKAVEESATYPGLVTFKLKLSNESYYVHDTTSHMALCSYFDPSQDRFKAYRDFTLSSKIWLYADFMNAEKRVDLFARYGSSPTQAITGFFRKVSPIHPEFMSLRLAQGKAGYEKTIDTLTLWNDSLTPCELKVGLVSNYSVANESNKEITDKAHGVDFNSFDFENTDFVKNNVPRFYVMRNFLRAKHSFTLCFTANSKRNSVLPGVDILYKLRKATRK